MSQACYGHSSPNAVILPNYGSCNPQASSISLCCENGQTCLTNGLCVTESGVYYNGGCTDSTYKAAICPTFCTSGDANWVIECHGSAVGAVKDGDFCCSVNGTTTTCCNTASNGLGLVAAVSSAQATSVGASTVRTSASAGTVPISVGASIADSVTSTSLSTAASAGTLTSKPLSTATSQRHGSTDIPQKEKVDIALGVTISAVGILTLYFIVACVRRWIKRRRSPGTITIGMNNLREESDKSGPQELPAEGLNPAEVEGSPVGPVEMDAN